MTRPLTALVALHLLIPAEALACGGFFCFTEPIDQSKERIVFAINENAGTVETHVQIFYQGAAEEFSWVVPVPNIPDVGLTTDLLFSELAWRTAPAFQLEYEERGSCVYDGFYGNYDVDEDVPVNDSAGGGPPQEPGVEIIEQTQVGPYEQVTLRADSAEALLTWLNANGYLIPDSIGDKLTPYVASESYFIALKLQKDKDAGDIAPVKFTYTGDGASIPLVLTSIAATPDMRLEPYIFADSRAVPDNYLHVRINEAAINWLQGGVNYDDVITQAANEAGGQAFATDYAGSTDLLHGAFWAPGRYDTEALADLTHPGAFIQGMLEQGFPSNTQIQDLIREFIPMPQSAIDAGLSEQDFYNCLECYPEHLDEVDFDARAFADALEQEVVKPLHDVEDMVRSYPYLTRMTSSMSPEEMTIDPLFTLNPTMGDESNVHHAKYVIDCSDGGSYSEAPNWIELADGTVILMPPMRWYEDHQVWTYESEQLGDIAALEVEDTTADGEPTTMVDNQGAVDEDVNEHNGVVQQLYADIGVELPDGLGFDTASDPRGCGCQTTSPLVGTGLSGGLLGLLALVRRRRR